MPTLKLAIQDRFGGVIKTVIETLYQIDGRRIMTEREKLLARHNELSSSYALAFLHRGEIYTPNGKSLDRNQLQYARFPHPDIDADVNRHITLYLSLVQEKKNLEQRLIVALRPCTSLQDVRDMLPDCAVKLVEELNILPRTRAVGFLLQGNPENMARYQKAVERMEMLSVVNLFY